ncbi:MAG: GatB/YqeY domain-containing protein [Candidatus Hydrogenedentes bacterium]|nr:GatB/YqeY domain-containing protein [Candidatus Hydrogenedentota bacterium]
MSLKERVQDAMKSALKDKNTPRLECLRMVKAALLLKEKESVEAVVTDEMAIAVLRAEVKKRQQSLDIFRDLGKTDEAAATEHEIAIINEFLPQQLSEVDLEAKVRAHLAAHPELNHAGKLTGAMKKELGDLADGRMLNEVCKRVVGG